MKSLLNLLLCAALLAALMVVVSMAGFGSTVPHAGRGRQAGRDDKPFLLEAGTSGCGRSEEGDAFESSQLRDLFHRLKVKETPAAADGEREKTPAP
jgi:hypothetical protein